MEENELNEKELKKKEKLEKKTEKKKLKLEKKAAKKEKKLEKKQNKKPIDKMRIITVIVALIAIFSMIFSVCGTLLYYLFLQD